MAIVKLFSARACPYAHRVRLVLSHKKVAFESVEIDLQNKPSWFTSDVSGYGKVPAIEHDGNRLWESAIVDEYLDETFPHPPLLPAQPGRRALARIWIDYANTHFAPAFGKLLRARNAEDRSHGRRELAEILSHIERQAFSQLSAAGPFCFGPSPSLVDFSFYPWFERWVGLEQLHDFPVSPELTRLARFRAAMRELPAVREHENSAEYYLERYAKLVAPRN